MLRDPDWNPVSKLYNNKLFSDIELECDGKTIYAHKAILTVRSEKYRALFESGIPVYQLIDLILGMKESRQSKFTGNTSCNVLIQLVDQIPFPVFEIVVNYMYKDEAALGSDTAVDVLVCGTGRGICCKRFILQNSLFPV